MMKNSKRSIDFHKTNVTKPPKEKEGKQEKSPTRTPRLEKKEEKKNDHIDQYYSLD